MEILYTQINMAVLIAIPKKRGRGYLRWPVGDHANALSKFCDYEIPGVSACASDGWGLQLSMRGSSYAADKAASMVANFLGATARRISHEEYDSLFGLRV